MNALPYNGFRDACESAAFYYPRPYGIYHKGETYWHKRLPRKPGSVVRFFEDPSGPVLSLVVLTIDGEFLCSAYPISWVEDDHPVQHDMKAWWEALTQSERDEILRESE